VREFRCESCCRHSKFRERQREAELRSTDGGAAAINMRRMETFCNLRLGHKQPVHTLHRLRQNFVIPICFTHLLCKALFLWTPVWIHTHLHVHSHLRSSKTYVLPITSAYTIDPAQYTRDIITNAQHPSNPTNHVNNPIHVCIPNALSSPSHMADLANMSPHYSPPLAFLQNPYSTPPNDRRFPTTLCSLPKINPQ
jgi:hypothetical protein